LLGIIDPSGHVLGGCPSNTSGRQNLNGNEKR